jgi:hypothetical protein
MDGGVVVGRGPAGRGRAPSGAHGRVHGVGRPREDAGEAGAPEFARGQAAADTAVESKARASSTARGWASSSSTPAQGFEAGRGSQLTEASRAGAPQAAGETQFEVRAGVLHRRANQAGRRRRRHGWLASGSWVPGGASLSLCFGEGIEVRFSLCFGDFAGGQ